MRRPDREPDLLYMSVYMAAVGTALQWALEIATGHLHVFTG
jgi:hypothetical protein